MEEYKTKLAEQSQVDDIKAVFKNNLEELYEDICEGVLSKGILHCGCGCGGTFDLDDVDILQPLLTPEK